MNYQVEKAKIIDEMLKNYPLDPSYSSHQNRWLKRSLMRLSLRAIREVDAIIYNRHQVYPPNQEGSEKEVKL